MALKYNGPLQIQMNDIAQVAGYMWEKDGQSGMQEILV